MITDFAKLLPALVSEEVEFILVGGVAAVLHGSARSTQDLDVVYRRSPENIERLVRSLAALNPYPRGAPEGLPFSWDTRTVRNGCNFTLQTSAGDLDLLGEITGGGGYERLIDHSTPTDAFGVSVHVLDLEELIRVKRAAGRPKDFEAIAELELLLEERKKP